MRRAPSHRCVRLGLRQMRRAPLSRLPGKTNRLKMSRLSSPVLAGLFSPLERRSLLPSACAFGAPGGSETRGRTRHLLCSPECKEHGLARSGITTLGSSCFVEIVHVARERHTHVPAECERRAGMNCGWRRLAVGCLFVLSFVNLFVLLPIVVVFVRDSRPAAGKRTFLSAAEQTSLRLPPFSDAAVQGWRRVRDRRGQSDVKWARRILRNVWCNPASTASRPAWNSSVAEVLALLTGRSQLDRRLATAACIQACDEARLQWVADANADAAMPDEMSYRCAVWPPRLATCVRSL